MDAETDARGWEMTIEKAGTHITGVKTVGIPVVDQERALRFYVNTLGLELRRDETLGTNRWVEVAPAGSVTTLALVRGPDQVRMGIDAQVRLSTDDIDAVFDELRHRGLDVYPASHEPGIDFMVRDPDGNRIVFVQDR